MKFIIVFLIFASNTIASPATSADIEFQKNKMAMKRLVLNELTMDIEKMKKIISSNNIEYKHQNNTIMFDVNGFNIMIIYDVNADRMRIVCPIIKVEELAKDQLTQAMHANFHTALDARYAISNGIVWSVFIHPLSDLSESLFLSAIEQTLTAAVTFGEEYSSGALSFPEQPDSKKDSNEESKIKTEN